MSKKFLVVTLLTAIIIIGGCGKKIAITEEQTTTPETKYTLTDVQTHNSKESCRVVLENKVYDVTDYVSLHPGGDKILNGCGKDITEMFQKVSAHVKITQILLNKYYIGELE